MSSAANKLAAAKAKLAAIKAAKPASRAASPRAASPARSVSTTRKRNMASMLANLERRRNTIRAKESNAVASSMSTLEALAAKPAKRGISNEINSLERKVVTLEKNLNAKLQAAENYKERRANSRGRYEQESLAAPQWMRPGVRTSQRKAANNKVEAINKEYKRMIREAGVAETALRHAREDLAKKTVRMKSIAASAATSRTVSPTGSVRSVSSTRSTRRLTANNMNAKAKNLRERLRAQQTRKLEAAKKKENADAKKIADAYKKMEGFDEDVLDAFCEDLKAKKRQPMASLAASRAASPVHAVAAANNLNNLLL